MHVGKKSQKREKSVMSVSLYGNVVFVVIELVMAIATGSQAVLLDADVYKRQDVYHSSESSSSPAVYGYHHGSFYIFQAQPEDWQIRRNTAVSVSVPFLHSGYRSGTGPLRSCLPDSAALPLCDRDVYKRQQLSLSRRLSHGYIEIQQTASIH